MTNTTELRKRFDTEVNKWLDPMSDYGGKELVDFLISEIEQAERAKEEQFKEDYIEWVLDSKPYTGQTPFQEWKMQAEVRQMSDWK